MNPNGDIAFFDCHARRVCFCNSNLQHGPEVLDLSVGHDNDDPSGGAATLNVQGDCTLIELHTICVGRARVVPTSSRLRQNIDDGLWGCVDNRHPIMMGPRPNPKIDPTPATIAIA